LAISCGPLRYVARGFELTGERLVLDGINRKVVYRIGAYPPDP